PSTTTPPPNPQDPRSTPPAVSWPAAFLTSVIVLGGFCYHYLSVGRGADPVQALYYLLVIAVPLTVLVLPASSAGAAARSICRMLSALFASMSGGGAR
ncbi:hypothetical protein, partial [Nocardia farcinica]|uniref:hypothetical protein n=1 Tax=Nocardia farcinica TaxID=37329 RepID=UPI001C0EFDDF